MDYAIKYVAVDENGNQINEVKKVEAASDQEAQRAFRDFHQRTYDLGRDMFGKTYHARELIRSNACCGTETTVMSTGVY